MSAPRPRRAVTSAALLLALAVLAAPALLQSTNRPEGLFSRLHRAERQLLSARDDLQDLEAQRDAQARQLGERVALRDVSRRATVKLRRDLGRQAAHWEAAHAQIAQRAPLLEPGVADDLAALLKLAEPHARRGQRPHLIALNRASHDDNLVAVALHQQAALTIASARAQALVTSARASRDRLRDAPRDGDALRAELGRCSAELGRLVEDLRPNASQEDFHRLKGTLRAPWRGSATADRDPHRGGLIYRPGAGDEVRAVQRGVVAHVGPRPCYGLLVVVDHGGGYHSVYGHLHASSVRVGQAVSRGDQLGTVGSSGSLDGPQLIFELRDDGRPVDSRSWFFRLAP